MNAFEFFARCVVNQNVEHCFALLGDANMQVAATMADLGVTFTYVQHEHCAVAASMAYAKKNRESRSIDRNLRSGAHADHDNATSRRSGQDTSGHFRGRVTIG